MIDQASQTCICPAGKPLYRNGSNCWIGGYEAVKFQGVSGIGGEVRADVIDIAAVEDYGKGDQFDLILLATKG